MQEPRSPTAQVIRLAVAVAVASIGAILVVSGLLGMFGTRDSAPGASSLAGVTAQGPSAAGPSAAGSPVTPPASSAAASAEPAPSPSGSAAASGAPSSSTAPSGTATSTADPVLVGAGDIGRCDTRDDDATADLIAGIPGLVFTLGDNVYEAGSPAEFKACYGPSWGRLLDRTVLPVVGNHDYETPGAAGYKAYFGKAATPDGVTWYSTDIGTWHVIVLDANCGEIKGGCVAAGPQGRWLRDDLAASTARCTLALWHQPRFSSGDEHGNDPAVGPFWDLLYAAGADLVLNGHDHDYERFAPQDPRGRADAARGITEMVVGTGGAPLRGFNAPVRNSLVRANIAHGVEVLTLEPSGWGFRFVSTDGSFSDQGHATCH